MSAEHDHLPHAPQDYATASLSELLRAVWRDPATPDGVVPYRFDDIEGEPALEYTADLLADIPSEHLRLVAAAARALNEAAMLAHLRRMNFGPFSIVGEDPAAREWPHIDDGTRLIAGGSIDDPAAPLHPWLAPGEAERLAADIDPHPFWLPTGYFSPACMEMVMRGGDDADQCGLPADHPIHHVQEGS